MDQQLQAVRWKGERHVAELRNLGRVGLTRHIAGLKAQLEAGAPEGAPEFEFLVAIGDEIELTERLLAC